MRGDDVQRHVAAALVAQGRHLEPPRADHRAAERNRIGVASYCWRWGTGRGREWRDVDDVYLRRSRSRIPELRNAETNSCPRSCIRLVSCGVGPARAAGRVRKGSRLTGAGAS